METCHENIIHLSIRKREKKVIHLIFAVKFLQRRKKERKWLDIKEKTHWVVKVEEEEEEEAIAFKNKKI